LLQLRQIATTYPMMPIQRTVSENVFEQRTTYGAGLSDLEPFFLRVR
jgi:hypothetical protein